MSMETYAVIDFGFVLDENIIKLIASKMFDDYAKNADNYDGYALCDEDICTYFSNFTGETKVITDSGEITFRTSEYYEAEDVFYVPLSNRYTLFSAPYNTWEEVIEEIKTTIGEFLPEDYDYKSRIFLIFGTCYG